MTYVPVRVVLDTNVVIAALRSAAGASFQILSRVGSGAVELELSVPLVLEYESVAKRHAAAIGLTPDDVDAVIDTLCASGRHREIYFHWRPALPDPKDDMLLELAVGSGCPYIVTHNLKHFVGAERFGVAPIAPRTFLGKLRALPDEYDQPSTS